MKKILLIIILPALGFIFLSSCEGCSEMGNGHVIKENRPVTPFTKISIEGIFPVEISQTGEAESVQVETDKNLQNYIVVENNGSELVIKTKDKVSIRRSSKMKVYINIKDLRELRFSSVGNLSSVNTLKLDSLELTSESVGKLDLDIQADFLRANLNSVGSTDLQGHVREVRINNKSVGTLSAYDLKAGTLMIHNTAVGTAEIYADSAFYIRSSAIGTLYYKGPGEVKELSSEGIGKVKKVD